jgi:hypothetical protein
MEPLLEMFYRDLFDKLVKDCQQMGQQQYTIVINIDFKNFINERNPKFLKLHKYFCEGIIDFDDKYLIVPGDHHEDVSFTYKEYECMLIRGRVYDVKTGKTEWLD